MVDQLLFAVYVTAFVAILYTAQHVVAARWSSLQSRDRDGRWIARESRSDAQDRD